MRFATGGAQFGVGGLGDAVQVWQPAASSFTPASISGLNLWLDSRTGMYTTSGGSTLVSSDGDPVGRWEDQSGNANHATQATSTKRGTFKVNASAGGTKDVVRFDGVDDFLACNSLAAAFSGSDKACSVFVVFKSSVTTGNPIPFSISNVATSDNPRHHCDMLDSAGYRLLRRDDGGTLLQGSSGTRDTGWHRFCYCFDGTSGQLYDAGATVGGSLSLNVGNCTFDVTTIAGLRFNSGGYDTASGPLQGDIAALLVYQAALTSGDVTNLDAWASAIWG